MSMIAVDSFKMNEPFNSEKDLSKYALSTETSLQQFSSIDGIYSTEEIVQVEEKFCSCEDLNPDQIDEQCEDDCTEDEDEFDQPPLIQTKQNDFKQFSGDLQVSPNIPHTQEVLDDQSTFPLDSILPCTISNLRIRKLTWNDFAGTPNYDLKWSAHAFWGINYTYTVGQKTAKNKKVSYVIKPEVNVWLKKKSWAKKHNPHLLNHEQGHYIIGCFCGLEFKKQIETFSFTDNYRFEIPRLFEKILKEHIAMEKRYDKETNHRLNREKQTSWDNFMMSKLQEYQTYFQKISALHKNVMMKATTVKKTS